MSLRVIVFIDAKNMYGGARDAFFDEQDSHVYGQYNPIALAQLISQRRPIGREKDERALLETRVYIGRPDSSKDPKTYGSHMRQCSAWEKQGVKVFHRPLRYPWEWPSRKPYEKGVDVELAVDFVTMAMRDAFDIGIIASTDTDIRPAIEYVLDEGKQIVEVAAWRSDTQENRLSIKNKQLWCHFLYRNHYEIVCDHTHYTVLG